MPITKFYDFPDSVVTSPALLASCVEYAHKLCGEPIKPRGSFIIDRDKLPQAVYVKDDGKVFVAGGDSRYHVARSAAMSDDAQYILLLAEDIERFMLENPA